VNRFFAYVALLYLSLIPPLIVFSGGLWARDLRDPLKVAVLLLPLGLMIGLPVMGWRYLKERTRTREVMSPEPEGVDPAVLKIPLPHLRDRPARRYEIMKIAAAGFCFGAGGILLSIVYPDLGSPDPAKAHLARLFLGVGLAVTFLIVATVVPIVSATTRRALALTLGRGQELRLDDKGIEIPLWLLTQPAFFRCVEAGKVHLFIPWSDLVGWSIETGVGDARSQHLLTVAGESAIYGKGPLLVLGAPCFGILRAPLARDEARLLEAARRHLGCPIVVNDEIVR
jgi:hypothetical protein